MDDFTGKIILVTGAARGIGYEIANQFYQHNGIVFLNDIDKDLCISSAKKIDPRQDRCKPLPGDVSNVDSISQMIQIIIDQKGKIDIVIANAGITLFKDFMLVTQEDLQKVIQLNIVGTFMLFQAASKQMIQQHTKGKLIAMSSITGSRAHKDLATYGMTKAAIESLVQNLVLDISKYGITINAIAPGATLTERTTSNEHYKNTWAKLTPTGRTSTPTDIANLVLFLSSEKADQITGQTLIVDGGWSSSSPGPEYVES